MLRLPFKRLPDFLPPLAVGALIVTAGSFVLTGAKPAPDLQVELISIGLDGQAGSGDYYARNASEIRNGAVSADGLTDCLDRLDCRQDPACKTGGGGNSGGGGGKNR